jgi:hypothetical protein
MGPDGSNSQVAIPGSLIARLFDLDGLSVASAFISPDASKIALVVCRPGDCSPTTNRLLLFTSDLSTSADIGLSGLVRSGQWSRDGLNLMLTLDPGGTSGTGGLPIYVVSASPDSFGTISKFKNASTAFWSADATHIYYYRYVSSGSSFFVSPADGSNPQSCQDCPLAYVSYNGAASPDGQMIAFSAGPDVQVSNSDFSNARIFSLGTVDPATGDPALSLETVDWSPDGQTIAVEARSLTGPSSYGAVDNIWLLNLDGTARPFVEANAPLTMCGWSPDSRAVVYASFDRLAIHPIDPQVSPTILPFSGGCPSWLPSQRAPEFPSAQTADPIPTLPTTLALLPVPAWTPLPAPPDYDAFQGTALNSTLWARPASEDPTAFSARQTDGYLQLDAHSPSIPSSITISATRPPSRSMTLTSPFEAEIALLQVTSPTGGMAIAAMSIDADIDHWYVACWILANAGDLVASATCQVREGDPEVVAYSTDFVPVPLGTSQRVRIEFDPGSAALHFYLNGTKFGSYMPSTSEDLIDASFFPSVGLFARPGVVASARFYRVALPEP